MASLTEDTLKETQEPGFITITRDYNPEFDRDAFLSTLGIPVLEPQILPTQEIPIAPVAPVNPTENDESVPRSATTTKKNKSGKPDDASLSKPITRRLKIKKPLEDAGVSSSISSQLVIPSRSYYMNNRNIFTTSIMEMFRKKALSTIDKVSVSCEQNNEEFSLMTHQKIVREYLQTFSPYRGLLLFHGLGSGKTCSAIAIAEGNKNTKRIIIMSPASLHTNFYEELKKCGDLMYRQKNNWVFKALTDINSTELENKLSLSRKVILQQKGIWVCDSSKPSNFETLTTDEQTSISNQIDAMIKSKYQFIHYNGLRKKDLITLFGEENNLLDGAVVIVDEAHNLISRIVNKISVKQKTISSVIYNKLMTAVNSKIILLTGTPMINYPNEIGVLFNILRGVITTWNLVLNKSLKDGDKLDKKALDILIGKNELVHSVLDNIEYSPQTNIMTITRNPFGYINQYNTTQTKYEGVKYDGSSESVTDDIFLGELRDLLGKNGISVLEISRKDFKALPDELEKFNDKFLSNNGTMKESDMFKRRIIGLTSYFRSAQEELMPKYEVDTDFKVIKLDMSDYQFEIYQEARVAERKSKKKKPAVSVNELYSKTSSTYRIFSRLFCNFVFPSELKRPMPDKIYPNKDKPDGIEDIADVGEEDVDNQTDELSIEKEDEVNTSKQKYTARIQESISKLFSMRSDVLTLDKLGTFSPKFKAITENIINKDNIGINLVYSQFRSLEGIGILSLVLKTNGFTQFKIVNKSGWRLDIPQSEFGKPMYALYTGTEADDEKEIIRNVLNNNWNAPNFPATLRSELQSKWSGNILGEVIKVLMITSSGAEGISLKNVRFVHICEPYWHPVRIEQVIGRARRICSHKDLPIELQTINVKMYLMSPTKEQSGRYKNMLYDKSKNPPYNIISTDETLYEIAKLKETINANILKMVKESSIDCMIHVKTNNKEKLQCFITNVNSSITYLPDISMEDTDKISNANRVKVSLRRFTLLGNKYILNENTNELYDAAAYDKHKINNVIGYIEDGNVHFNEEPKN